MRVIDRRRSTRYPFSALWMVGFVAPLVGLGPTPLHAQEPVDEGVFEIRVAGSVVGSEEFTIGRTGSGAAAAYISGAEIRLEIGGEFITIEPRLKVMQSSVTPSEYRLEVAGSEELNIALKLSTNGQRFEFLRQSSAGRQEGEFRASPGTILLDDWIVHQYYFWGMQHTQDQLNVRVIRARDGRTFNGQSRVVAREPVTVGGTELQARKIEMAIDGETNSVWIDDSGRVLRLEIPRLQLVATRVAPPS